MSDNKKGWFDDDPEWEDLRKRSENPQSDSKIDQWMDRFEVWLDNYQWPWKRKSDTGSSQPPKPLETQKRQGYFSDLNQPRSSYQSQNSIPQHSRQTSTQHRSPQKQPEKNTDKVEVSINVTLPKFSKLRKSTSGRIKKAKTSLPNLKKISLPTVKKKYLAGVAGLIIVIVTVPLVISQTKDKSGGNSGTSEEQAISDQKPSVAQFKVFMPSDVNSTQARYDQDKQISSYQDTINGVNLTITQQALPEKFKTNTAEEIKSFATAQNFKDSLSVDKGVAYVGMSAFGPQSVVYQKDQTLIFIQSVKKIPNSTWVKYLNGLQ